MPERNFRCHHDPGASFRMGWWLCVVRKGARGLCAHPDLASCLTVFFFFFSPGSTKQEQTFSCSKWSPWSPLDILTDTTKIETHFLKHVPFSSFLQRITPLVLDLVLRICRSGLKRQVMQSGLFLDRCPCSA